MIPAIPLPSLRRRWLIAAMLASGVGCAFSAAATCKLAEPGFVPQDVKIAADTVVLLPTAKVGDIVKTISGTLNANTAGINCRGGGYNQGRFANGTAAVAPVAGVPPYTYPTAIPGIGVRVYRDSGPIQFYFPYDLQAATGDQDLRLNLQAGSIRIDVIKTAEQTGSGVLLPAGPLVTYALDGDGPGKPFFSASVTGRGLTVVTPTCSVAPGGDRIAVELGTVANTEFTGVGSRSRGRDFDIRLDCKGSNLDTYQKQIGITLTANQDPSNMPGVLSLTAGPDTARRVGIQIMRREGSAESEIRFNQSIPAGTSSGAPVMVTLPLRARYIQTEAGTVGAGIAGGTAQFTITYQ